MQQYKYSIDEENKDPMDSVILKEGLQAKFTLRELEDSHKRALKIEEEILTQNKLDKAQMQNVVNNNPDLFKEVDGEMVPKCSEKKLKEAVALALWNGLNNKVKQTNEKIEEIREAFDGFAGEIKDIKEQTGLELKIESPFNNEQTN